jgi:colanic acid biosynthesis glycosyl transferase WcaI
MRIVFWSPNYAPEWSGIPPLITDACDALAAHGHEVAVVCALPNYPERRIYDGYRGRVWVRESRGDVCLTRTWLRVKPAESAADKVLYELSFAATSTPPAVWLSTAADVIVCVVPTVGTAMLASLMRALARPTRRGPKVAIWFQDLVGRAALSVGGSGVIRSISSSVASRAEIVAARLADRVIVCSPGFKEILSRSGIPEEKISVVLNWVNTDEIAAVPEPPVNRRLEVLYAGNFGYTQGFSTLAKAISRVEDIRVRLVGAGNALGEVQRLVSESDGRMILSKPVPRGQLSELLANHHAHLVLQRAIASGANLPSKIATYLASGRPIVASMDESTPGARLLAESGAAFCVPPEDPVALADALSRLKVRATREQMGVRARRFAVERFDASRLLSELERSISATAER